MKSYTDLKQSKKLASILPIESADMWWSKNFIYYNPTAAIGISAEYSNVYTYKFGEDDIPCWSLAALLDILPHCIDDRYNLVLGKLSDNKGWYVMYDDIDHFVYFYITKSDLIDACVEMIIRLKEDNLI